MMSQRLALAVLLLAATGPVLAQQPSDVQRRFTGHWRLVSFENFDEKGVPRPGTYTSGRIMYDAAGHMSAQLTQGGRTPLSTPSTESERAAAYASYIAYFGRYQIDEAKRTVTHVVEGSTNPNWPNTRLVRFYGFSADGNRLMLSLKNAEGRVTGTLTWERLR